MKLFNTEERAQIREFITEYVTDEFNRTRGINKNQMITEIFHYFKTNWINYTVGIVTGTVNKVTDKLIYNIG